MAQFPLLRISHNRRLTNRPAIRLAVAHHTTIVSDARVVNQEVIAGSYFAGSLLSAFLFSASAIAAPHGSFLRKIRLAVAVASIDMPNVTTAARFQAGVASTD
jgi:hypothetical protein